MSFLVFLVTLLIVWLVYVFAVRMIGKVLGFYADLTIDRFLWLAFFALTMWLFGDVDIYYGYPPLGWWLVAIGAGCFWARELYSAAPSTPDRFEHIARCEPQGSFSGEAGGPIIGLHRTGPASYG